MRLLLLAGIILILAITLVHGHEAPSGWQYPTGCCQEKDCRPIACSTIKDNPDGSVTWTGLYFDRSQVRMSGDASCHVCIGYAQYRRGFRFAHCIFLAPTM